jgi:hypothetical protein
VIREVEEIEKKKKRKIDSKIRPLVIGLRRWGINTEYSCQGHKYKHKFPFPWIDISQDSENVSKALMILALWNIRKTPLRTTIKWVILPMRWPTGKLFIRLLPRNQGLSDKCHPLKEMQRDAIEFGEFLQKLPKFPMTKRRPKRVLKLLPIFSEERIAQK